MTDILNLDDLLESQKKQIYSQSYAPKQTIEGVQIIEINDFVGDEGDFSEILRLNEDGNINNVPNFKVRQINRTRMISGCIKAWHLHLKQNEIWYVLPRFQLLTGLWDLRKNSKTTDVKMRFTLGGGKSQLLVIPKGVAHGTTNLTKEEVEMFYFVDQLYSPENPDEYRLHWDSCGETFWKPERD